MSESKSHMEEMDGFEFGKRDPSFFLEFDQDGHLILPNQEKEIGLLLEAWCEGDLDPQDHSLVTKWILESPERTKFVRDALHWTGGKTVSLAVLPEQWSKYMVDGSATNGQPESQFELHLPEVGHGVKAKIFARKDGEWEISVGKVTAVTVNGEVTDPKMTCLLPDTLKIKGISMSEMSPSMRFDYICDAAEALREVSKTRDVTKSILVLVTEMYSDYVKSSLGEFAEGEFEEHRFLVARLAQMRYALWDSLQNIAHGPNAPEDVDADFSLFDKLDEVLQSHGIQKAVDQIYERADWSLLYELEYDESRSLAELAVEFPEEMWWVPTKLKK